MWEWLSEHGIWLVTWCLLGIGVAGTVLPLIPGQLLILFAAIGHWWVLRPDSHLGWWTFVVLGLVYVVSQLLEAFSGAIGSKWFGGSRWGAGGAVIGAVVGLFFMPWGLLLGPLLGAFVAESIFDKKEIRDATKSGIGSAVGTMVGIGIKMGIALLMAIYLVVDLFWV